MKIKLIVLILMFLPLAAWGCGSESKEESPGTQSAESYETADKDKAADFTLTTTDGKELKLSDYKGKVVILDFWATWCGPCRKGIPDLVDLQNKYKNDLVVIGISLDAQTKKDVVPFMKEFNVNYPVVYGNAQVVKAYGNIQAIPTAFVIDREGNVVDRHVGLQPKSVYEDKIKSLL